MKSLAELWPEIQYRDAMAAWERGELAEKPVHPDDQPKPEPSPILARLRAHKPRFTASQRRQMAKPYRLKPGERRCAYSKAKVRKPLCREPECQSGQCKRLKALGLKDDRTPLAKTERPFCNKLTKKGRPCKARVVPGKTKCRVHGGCSNGPTTPEGKAKTAAAMREGFFKHRDRIMAQRHAAKAERDAAKEAATAMQPVEPAVEPRQARRK